MEKAQRAIREFNKERSWQQFHSLENLAKSISIEAGELLECFQWDSSCDNEVVYEELADVLIYCLQMADQLEVNPEEIIMKKIQKNKKKYPINKAKGNCIKYNKLNGVK